MYAALAASVQCSFSYRAQEPTAGEEKNIKVNIDVPGCGACSHSYIFVVLNSAQAFTRTANLTPFRYGKMQRMATLLFLVKEFSNVYISYFIGTNRL